MSFIFRAYHAMARQRPMSTRTGIPTAATYVFVNMLRKLRDDFSPEYLAAVFDVSAPTFRDRQAEAISVVRKWDIKTQSFQETKYAGYKANRSQMPGDLAQQIPYIRRALEAYRIPILQSQGYEADDVIGTLSEKAVGQGYSVYVVSSDKDMLQLVNDQICVLNPPKDNLICDSAKVEEILGVPPERVVDVMALRGDSIDNILGAPGIGDKGSVELIKRFGSVEAALDHAAEVEKKTYRESLLNNREAVMMSKQLVTIDRNVPIDLDVDAMVAGEPDLDALRQLFTELEFTSLLKELLPAMEVGEVQYTHATSPTDIDAVLKLIPKDGALAIAIEMAEPAGDEEDDEEPEEGVLPLTVAAQPTSTGGGHNLAISAAPSTAVTVPLDLKPVAERLGSVLADHTIPKTIHDGKRALHTLATLGIEIAGLHHEPMLYSYLLDPTYSSHSLAEIALRRFNLKLAGGLSESADISGRFAQVLREQVEQAGLLQLY